MSRSHVLDVYGTNLWLCTRKAEWKNLAKTFTELGDHTPDKETAGQVSTFTHQPKHGLAELCIAIWIDVRRHHNNTPALIDTIAHEASHAAGRILQHTGHDVEGTDEPHAYLVGWLTKWIWQGVTDGAPSLR